MVNYKKLAKKSSKHIPEEEFEALSKEERSFVIMCSSLSEAEKADYVARYEAMDRMASPKSKGTGCASMIAIFVVGGGTIAILVSYWV